MDLSAMFQSTHLTLYSVHGQPDIVFLGFIENQFG